MRPGDTTRYMTPKVPLRERARPTTSCRPGPLTRRASRSEAMMVAVDFSPRTQGVSCSGVAERRLKITVLFDRSAVVPRRRIVCSPRSVGSSPRLREMGRKCPNSRAGSSDPESWIHFPTTRLRVHADRTGDQRRIDGDDSGERLRLPERLLFEPGPHRTAN